MSRPNTRLADGVSGPSVYDLVVVGAGLAGSALAATMAANGHRVLLLERSHFPRHKVCGEFLSPEVQSTLAGLQLDRAVKSCDPHPLSHVRLVGRGGQELVLPLPGTAWGLSRFALDAALATTAVRMGATLHSGSFVRDYARDMDGYTVFYQQGGRMWETHGRALVMAVGRQSGASLPPRRQAKTTRSPYVGVKLHLRDVRVPDQVALFMFDGGYVGVNPVEGGAVNVCLMATYAAFARGGRSPQSMVKMLSAEQPSFAELLAGAAPVEGSDCTVAGIDTHRPARPWEGLPCVGDTAAMIPPLCGDGMAMALRSAELMAPLADAFLRGALSYSAWEAAYTRQWQTEFAGRLRTGRILETLFLKPRLSDWALRAGQHLPHLARLLVRMTRGPITPTPATRDGALT